MRRIVLSALVLGLLALAWSFAPVELDVPELALEGLPPANPPPGMSVSALPTADLGSKAALAFRGGSFGDERLFSQSALLVRHPRGDLLIDTGLGTHAREHFATTPFLMRQFAKLTLHTPAATRLRANAYDLHELGGIVLTHAHWDHVSGVPDFPGVPLWMNAAESAFVHAGSRHSALLHSFGKLPTHPYQFARKPYLGFAESFDVWGDGSIVLVPAPGHTPGSILAFVTLPSRRRLALLGDMVWQNDGIERPAERPWLLRQMVDSDPERNRAAIEHVAALHRAFPELELLPAHDARAWAELPVFPASAQ
ncbi:MAG: MBL fold metallo-hydrolase [Polyangiales bacterium]